MGKATARRALHQLTAKAVHAAPSGDFGDGGGLVLRVSTASAAWVFRYTAPAGRRREMGLGPCLRGSQAQAGQSLTSARDAAHRAREQLRQGVDPIDERDRQRDMARQADAERRQAKELERWTLARCARDYHERVIEPNRTRRHAAQWIASLENHVPRALWHASADSITAPQLLAALQAIKPHQRARRHGALAETVSRIRQRLDAVYEDALFHHRASANPAAAIRRKLTEAKPPRTRGQLRALDWREAPELLARIRAVPGTAARALELAVVTASRTSEVLLAEWHEVDFSTSTWELPGARMKGRQNHMVFLSPRAVEILRGQVGQHRRWVFPSPMHPAKPLSNMAMTAVLERLQADGRTTVHGLARATFSTWANENGARPDVVEACLAHKEADRVRAAYCRATFASERRQLLERWAQYLRGSAAHHHPAVGKEVEPAAAAS